MSPVSSVIGRGASFTYNDEGELETGYCDNYTFDYEHRLTGMCTTSFTYDGSGNRVEAVRGVTTTRYVYDARGNLLAEADDNNQITRYYIYGMGLLEMVTPGNAPYCYHYDGTGNTIALTDVNQNVVKAYAYDPFGAVVDESGTIEQPFKFVGQFGVMAELNGIYDFYYMRARYYDPSVGRFISEDPAGFGGRDVNLYAYVQNNPVILVDPLGLCGSYIYSGNITSSIPTMAAGAAIGGGIGGPPGMIIGGIIGSAFGVGGNASYVPSTGSLYVGPSIVFAPALGGGNGVSVTAVSVPAGQDPNSIANGLSGSVSFQPIWAAGSTIVKSSGTPSVVGASMGTRVPVSFGAGYNFPVIKGTGQ